MVFNIRKKLFSKKKNIFYDLLLRQSAKTLEGLEALANYVDNCRAENAKQVKKCEVEADDLRLMLIQALDKTFVTPLDREDIFDLSRVIDDVMDYANSTVLEMEIYEVSADGHVKEMVNILISAGTRDRPCHQDSRRAAKDRRRARSQGEGLREYDGGCIPPGTVASVSRKRYGVHAQNERDLSSSQQRGRPRG